jgi:hypothetical protein
MNTLTLTLAYLILCLVAIFLVWPWLTGLRKPLVQHIVELNSARYDPESQMLTLCYSDGSMEQFYGSSTVWYEWPLMKRASPYRDGELRDLWKYCTTHGNPYPIAHERKNPKV